MYEYCIQVISYQLISMEGVKSKYAFFVCKDRGLLLNGKHLLRRLLIAFENDHCRLLGWDMFFRHWAVVVGGVRAKNEQSNGCDFCLVQQGIFLPRQACKRHYSSSIYSQARQKHFRESTEQDCWGMWPGRSLKGQIKKLGWPHLALSQFPHPWSIQTFREFYFRDI